MNERRTFLLCHLSPIACKRSLSESEQDQNPTMMIKTNLEKCLHSGKPIWTCLNQISPQTSEDMDHIELF